MKFTCTVDIKQPIDKVVELFDNVDNLYKWQEGLQSFEHISGTPGEPGAKSRMHYIQGKNDFELIETLLVNNLPEEMIGEYYHEHMTNTMRTTFVALSPTETRYTAEIEYSQFRGFMIKMMAFLMPGMFKKQTQKWLDRFRDFAEAS